MNAQCVTFDEWAAIIVGMLVMSALSNIVVAALILDNRWTLRKLLKTKKIDDREEWKDS